MLINVPSDINADKIKKITKKEIISSQVWFTASKNIKKKIIYDVTQILDIDDAKPKEYLKYNLKLEKYFIFKDFYFTMFFFYIKWNTEKNEILDYYEKILKKYETIDKSEFLLIKNKSNVSFIPDSADFCTYKIYVSLILFDSLYNIKNDEYVTKENILQSWYIF